MIEAVELRKEYGSFVAVEGSSFDVADGEIFGLIGPNGAGKTTTLKMLAGLIEPTDGHATVAGYDVATQEMRRHLGFLPEESPVYEEMTPRSYLRFFADLYDVEATVAEDRIESMLDRLELEYRDRPLGNVSKGMKRKVAIARSLVNDPDVLIYDEPASGLDPLTTNAIIEFVRELAAEDKTIVFSAHNLYHVESLCDRIAIMNDGRIVARGTLEEIQAKHGGVEYHVYTSVPVDGSEPDGDRHRVIAESMDDVESIRATLAERDGELLDVRTREASLEDIFLAVATDGTDAEDSPIEEAATRRFEPEARM
ncbi:MAG: ATP-binding cassette domain-containing protein [Halobacteriales archaeon]